MLTDKDKRLQELNKKYDFYFTCTKYGTYAFIVISCLIAIYVNL